MPENPRSWAVAVADPVEMQAVLRDIILLSERLNADTWQRWLNGKSWPIKDEAGLTGAFAALFYELSASPWQVVGRQMQFWFEGVRLWQNLAGRLVGGNYEPLVRPEQNDHRFKDDDWRIYPVFDGIEQAYLLWSRQVLSLVQDAAGLRPGTADKVAFYTRQFVDAVAPTNFPLTNPEVWREAARTGGLSLLRGVRNLLADLERGNGRLFIRTTDLEAFRLGENIAATPGKVVFRNEMMELLQYQPGTERVRRRPLLIVPPWINKFYILDLRAKNSFIKWAVDRGHTVFVISWVNPSARQADCTFDHYLRAVLAALHAIGQATGEGAVNTVGYCLGGTLLAMTLAYLTRQGDARIKSMTLLTTLLDFAEPGELGVFLDEPQIRSLEKRMQQRGFLDGSEMAAAFSLLRANDLIWSFFINNYLLGKDPIPFDLLYWNADSTRMPASMHTFYLRNFYLENRLREPGGIALDGQPIDLSQVRVPVYVLSAVDDHIAPWKTVYAGSRLFSGPVRFVLAGSGHIAGVINPPAGNKYGYRINTKLPGDADAWLRSARCYSGSWWTDWDNWINDLDGQWVPGRVPGAGRLKVLDDAPGAYVRRRLF